MQDKLHSRDAFVGALQVQASTEEREGIEGTYSLVCTDETGAVLWAEEFTNVVTIVGQNQLLAAALQGASYNVTGPFVGLISSVSYTAVAVSDTMASHTGWLEAGNANAPMYSGTRPTMTFSVPAGGTITSASSAVFVFTNTGTVAGAFVSFGAGATNAVDSTGGVLLSAGTFGSAQPVVAGNTLNVNYALAL